jgi:hypothetical protein
VSGAGRLYALSSTYTGPWWDGDGPRLLIDDPVVAMRWYLTVNASGSSPCPGRSAGTAVPRGSL